MPSVPPEIPDDEREISEDLLARIANYLPRVGPGLLPELGAAILEGLLRVQDQRVEGASGYECLELAYREILRRLPDARHPLTETLLRDSLPEWVAEFARMHFWFPLRRMLEWDGRFIPIGPPMTRDDFIGFVRRELTPTIDRALAAPGLAAAPRAEISSSASTAASATSSAPSEPEPEQMPAPDDPFGTQEQRENAIRQAVKKFGSPTKLAQIMDVDYRGGLRRWARIRNFGKRQSGIQARIETFLLPYAR